MKKRINYILSCFLILGSCLCFAQSRKTDSLLSILKTTKEDTTQVNILNGFFLEYEFSDDAKAKEYLDKALELSKKINYKKGLGISYTYVGYFAEDKGNYPEALNNYFASLKIKEAIGDRAGIADSYFCIGNVYFYQENYREALKKYTASLEIYESMDKKQSIATSHNNIGGVYFHLGNYPEALKKYSVALEMRKALGDKRGVADSYGNIGNVYSNLGNYPEAIKRYFDALKILEEMGSKVSLAGIYSDIGIVFTRQKKYKEAKEFLNKSRELSKEIGYKECLSSTYNGLFELDSAIGDFKGAYENHKLYILYHDSLDNEETRKKTIQSQMTFDFQKKEAVADAEHKKELENQQSLADEKSTKQKIVIVFVLIGLLVVLVFAGFIFRSLGVTRKQKIVIEEQKLLVEEKQKEVLDSIYYARRIQRSLLPTEKYIERNLKRLKDNLKMS